jgi:uncharacterized membrane protein YkvA (DUF1232 family)
VLAALKRWAHELKAQLLTLWFSRSHPDTPLLAKVCAGAVVAYAFSPIDLIPDFIPVIGYLDELILLPLGIYLVLRMIPEHVLAASRQEAERWMEARRNKPKSYVAAIVFVAIWLALAYWIWTVWPS